MLVIIVEMDAEREKQQESLPCPLMASVLQMVETT